jgi:hypothetical protein
MSTLNTYTVEDADDETGVGADDTLVKMQMTGKDELAWSFVKITISVGDNVYTCSVIAGDDCEITQAAGENDNAWEPGEYLFLKEGTEDICDGTFCPIGISITNGGRSVGGSPQIVIGASSSSSGSSNGGGGSSGPAAVCPENKFAVIETSADVSVYEPCTELDGVYLHMVDGTMDVSLPNLETVNGYVYFHQNDNVTSASFPNLQEVTKYVYFYHNSQIESVDLSSLAHVGEYLYFDGNNALSELDLTSSLTAVDDYVYIYNNADLCVPSLDWNDISDSVSIANNGQC